MAITKSAFTKDSGSSPRYTRADLIDQMESALSWGGCHGPAISGLIVSLDSYSGGSTIAGAGNTNYMDVSASGGSGSGATFKVERNSSGVVESVMVSRPGSGYADNETLTLAAADFGDTGSNNLTLASCNVMGGGSPTTFGSATTYFDKDTTGTYPWAVSRRVIESSKTYGDTYTAFQANSDTALYLFDGSSFHPENTDDTADDKHGYGNSFRGDNLLDFGSTSAEQDFYSNQLRTNDSDGPELNRMGNTITVSGGTDKALKLNTYKSALDTNFVVFSYNQPTRSSTSISDNTYSTFFLHNFTSSLWDYDHLYLGGYTEIIAASSGSSQQYPRLTFKTYWGNNGNGKRAAMWGYSCNNLTNYVDADYLSPFTPSHTESYHDVAFYVRTENTSGGGYNATTSRTRDRSGVSSLNASVYHNAVIKGVPLNAKLAPAPYYIPDDFVIINFEFHTTETNFQQGDTITVSGTEVYTIITASYDYDTTLGMTRGIAFCGRTT